MVYPSILLCMETLQRKSNVYFGFEMSTNSTSLISVKMKFMILQNFINNSCAV
jgi:hypothetical protein